MKRRTFLGTGITVAAGGATLAAGSGEAQLQERLPAATASGSRKNPLPHNPRTAAAMPMRNLGLTGYRVGQLSLGGQATLEIPGKEDESIAIINRAIDLGVNYIDSAASYGQGASEQHLGLVMKSRRKEVFLTSKTHDRSYDGSMRLMEKTLGHMKTDHLDLWQIHNLQRQDQLDEIFASNGAIKAMEKARDEGMASFLGVTGHYEPNILLEAIRRFPFDTILMAVNAADRHYLSFIEHLLPLAIEKRLGVVGMKVVTRSRMLSTWTPPPAAEQPERLRTAKPGTLTINEALAYNLTLPVSTNIIGVDNVKQIEDNVAFAATFTPLNETQMRDLEKRTLPIARQALYFRRWDLGA
ncbi:MAG: aldo/keto reductase [Bryobacterales bacterium]|nr:aldo/keto reductase [Bryobacterales bacterium]